MKREDLSNYLETLLEPSTFEDYGPNGLQVEGTEEINTIVTGVSGCVDLFEQAIQLKADAIIVHHGIIWWDFDRPIIKGSYKKRIKLLLDNDINLFGYHLPLDCHQLYGNNIQIAQSLGFHKNTPAFSYKGHHIGVISELETPQPKEELYSQVKQIINPNSLIFDYGPSQVQKIGIVSGSGESLFKEAIEQGVDCFITGEVKEHIMHLAKEEKISFISAGHHATERFGIKALGNHLKDHCNLDVSYVDIANPV